MITSPNTDENAGSSDIFIHKILAIHLYRLDPKRTTVLFGTQIVRVPVVCRYCKHIVILKYSIEDFDYYNDLGINPLNISEIAYLDCKTCTKD
jgi:hypothetical protein